MSIEATYQEAGVNTGELINTSGHEEDCSDGRAGGSQLTVYPEIPFQRGAAVLPVVSATTQQTYAMMERGELEEKATSMYHLQAKNLKLQTQIC